MSGTLTLIPSPIDEEKTLHPSVIELLENAFERGSQALFVVEEEKEGRRRWLRWGLPRDAVNQFVLLNEHNQEEQSLKLLSELKAGKDIFLISDCGLPAFCDPGQFLVDQCHRHKVRVTSSFFQNSVVLALALSGFHSKKFSFEGFLPRDKDERRKAWKDLVKQKGTIILMDAPYRLKKIKEELQEFMPEREIFIGIDLNQESELLFRGKIKNFKEKELKREFILILS